MVKWFSAKVSRAFKEKRRVSSISDVEAMSNYYPNCSSMLLVGTGKKKKKTT